jgi:signal transduction histidine kinase
MGRQVDRPLLFPFSSSLLAAGENRLDVRVRADVPGTGLLGPVYVGPVGGLERLYARRHRLKVTALWVITLGLVMVAVFMAALSAGWREETSYGWFTATAVVWAVLNLNGLIVDIPTSMTAWYALWYAALGWWAATQVRFLLAFMGERRRRLERAVDGLAITGTAIVVLLAAIGSPALHAFARLWVTVGLVAGAFTVTRVIRVLGLRGHDLAIALPYVLGLGVIVCAVHDWLLLVGLVQGTYDYYLPYSAPILIAGMGWALLDRFIGALRQTESLIAVLEERVERKRGELAESYERLREVEGSRVLAEERERMMREIHDGLGSHLVTTLSLIEADTGTREAIGGAIRSALDDLRMMVDSLEPLEGDLVGALAMLRTRLQPRLEAAGIAVEWQVRDLPPIADLGPQKVLHVMRIMQEAVTNVLKHAAARTITVRTVADRAVDGRLGVSVEIVDDGRGIADGSRAGRGLHHMRQRARDLGAVLDVRGSPRGTSVRLLVPVEASPVS